MVERGMSLTVRAAFVAAIVLSAAPAAAQIALTASNTNLLYSKDASPNCSELSKITDDAQLPKNVARLRVAVPGGIEGRALRFAWSMKKSAKGTLAADLDIGAAGAEVPAIDAMCADFGNACVLTKDRLQFYNEPTILWVAPSCAVLPNDTRKAFKGGVSRVQLKVLEGKRKIGKASVDLHWGMNGSVTIFVTDLDDQFKNGMPKPNPVQVFANPTFAYDAVAPVPLPPGTMTADFAGGGAASGIACPSRFDDCFQIIFPSAGRFIVVLTLFFEDGSALCDNITVNVAACSGAGKIDIIPRPKKTLYDPAKPKQSDVDLTVRLTNTSKPKGGLPACPFLMRGANILNCSSSLKLGTVNDTETTQFDLRHCSRTTDQPCDTDAECSQAVCGNCVANETCLTKPHCSKNVQVPCLNDLDCAKKSANCPTCEQDEDCVRVLEVNGGREIFLTPGKSIDLFHQPVSLRNVTGTTAKIKDTWTANVLIPELSIDRSLQYKIRGHPEVAPAP